MMEITLELDYWVVKNGIWFGVRQILFMRAKLCFFDSQTAVKSAIAKQSFKNARKSPCHVNAEFECSSSNSLGICVFGNHRRLLRQRIDGIWLIERYIAYPSEGA